MNAMILAMALAVGDGLPNPFYAMDTYTNRPYVSVALTPTEQLGLMKELGYDGFTWNEEPAAKLAAVVKEAEAQKLKLFAVYFAATATPEGTLSVSPNLGPALEVLEGRGTIVWLHIGGKGPGFADLKADTPAVAELRKVADEAAARGLKVAIYPHVNEWTERVPDAVRLARLVDRPNFGVTYNLCHSLAMGDEPRVLSVLEEAAPVLMTVTINGADAGVNGPDWKRLIQTLDRGTYDVAAVLRKLRELGFQGPIGVQGYAIGGDPRENLSRTIGAWRKLSEAAAR